LWVLDKPSGVLSHPNPPARSAANALFRCEYDIEREAYGTRHAAASATESPTASLFLVHRLDQDTSGLILCAFDAAAADALQQALLKREVQKEYLALVLGIPRAAEGVWRDCLQKRSRRGRVETTVVQGRPNAVTRFRTREIYEAAGAALLELSPETGRTHQLRVQAAARRLPIVGDDRYGDFAANRCAAQLLSTKRMFLHAHRLELRHPATQEMRTFTAPLDSEWTDALLLASRLRKLLRAPQAGKRRTSGE
jgi:RluA family pseudouridine synthase